MASNGLLVQPDINRILDRDELYRSIMQTVGRDQGLSDWGSVVNHVSHTSNTAYSHVLQNQGTGGHLNVPNEMQVKSDGTGTVIRALNVTSLTTTTLTVNGLATFNGSVILGDAAADTITVNGTPTFLAASTFKHNVTIQNAALTTLAAFVVTAGAQTVTLGAAATPGLYVDVANLRTLIGTATALGSATNDKAAVVGGRLYVAPAGETLALGLRFNNTVTGSAFVGASNSNTPDGILSNNAGTQIARWFNGGGFLVGTAAALTGTEQLEVSTGGLRVQAGGILLANSGNIDGNGGTAGQLRIGAVIVNGASLSGSEELRVVGQSRFEGEIANTSGGIVLSGPVNIDGNGGTAGQLRIGAVIVNAASLDGSEELLVNGQSRLKGATEVTTGGLLVSGGSAADTFTANGSNTVLTLSGSSQTQTTVGGAGGASALPATPRGYIKIVVGGNDRVIPFYDAS